MWARQPAVHVPSDAALPAAPGGSVLAYDTDEVPTSSDEIVEWQPSPSALDSDQEAAIQTMISFMTYINQQHFASAYAEVVAGAGGASPPAMWSNGWLTIRYHQVAFGEPKAVPGSPNLMLVPARWISRQNPNEQHARLDGSTCDYWPQYLFLMHEQGGTWYFTNDRYQKSASLAPFERVGADGTPALNPVAQRVDCS